MEKAGKGGGGDRKVFHNSLGWKVIIAHFGVLQL